MSLKPTKEEWDKFIEILSRPYGTVDCRVDGYEVTCQVRATGTLKYKIAVFIDGVIHGIDCERDNPKAKLYKETKYYPFRSQKWQKALTHYPKKQRNELRDRCVITITPLFSSAAGIKSRWLKTCEDIELIL